MIRTTDQLLSRIADDLIWRRKELTELRAMIQENRGDMRSRMLIRCAISLLYAHWEGFIKKSSAYYIEFVASHRVPYRHLAANFVGITLKAKYSELGANRKISGGNALADFFCKDLDRQSNVPYKNVVDTKSNLSSEVLLDILSTIGLDPSIFATRLKFIDANLVNRRNHVAHGEVLDISGPEYLDLHDDVLTLIDIFRNEVENASVLRRFDTRAA